MEMEINRIKSKNQDLNLQIYLLRSKNDRIGFFIFDKCLFFLDQNEKKIPKKSNSNQLKFLIYIFFV